MARVITFWRQPARPRAESNGHYTITIEVHNTKAIALEAARDLAGLNQGTSLMTIKEEDGDLLRAIVRCPSPAINHGINRLAGKVRDWNALLQIAEEHHVTPLLYMRLSQSSMAVPPEAQETLQAAYQRNVFHSMANAAELIALLKALAREGIAAIPFKGVVLAATMYGELAARPAGDLDILIRLEDRARATAILLNDGYTLVPQVGRRGETAGLENFEDHFERARDGMVTELRWRFDLIQSRFKRELGMDWVWPHRQTTVLAGAELPDLAAEILLPMLCMHGSKHHWSRLIWICDVAQLLAARPDLNWKRTIQEAKRSGLWRALALGVLLAHRVADADVPPAVLRRFESIGGLRRLAQHIDRNLFHPAERMPGTFIPYHLQLLGVRDRIAYLSSLDFLQPNERDYAVLNLPRGLRGLYYFIRPLRVFLDRSPR